jgi:4-hydroxy-3-methylbut-2-enyl diphosphate reductase
MEVMVAPNAGFCEGVNKAYRMVRKALAQNPCFCLHPIVHNKLVMENLSLYGLKQVGTLKELQPNDRLVINTHGVCPAVYEEAKAKRIQVIDATCPRVQQVQALARQLVESRRQLFITGDINHPETKGILGWCQSQAIVVGNIAEALSSNESFCPTALISQTTFPAGRFHEIANHLKTIYNNLKVYSTICPATELRQKGSLETVNKVDGFWVIGGTESANTRALLETVRKHHPSARLIQEPSDIKAEYLDGVSVLGITAGASTPPWCIREVIEKVKKISETLALKERSALCQS